MWQGVSTNLEYSPPDHANLIHLTFNCMTRSIRCLPSGLISFNMSAIMMSIPFDSWLAIAFCPSILLNHNQHNTARQPLPDFHGTGLGSILSNFPRFDWSTQHYPRWYRDLVSQDLPWCCRRCSLGTWANHTRDCTNSYCLVVGDSSAKQLNLFQEA